MYLFLQMRRNFLNLKKIFISFDRHLDGFINLEDLKSILIHFTMPMSDQLFTQLMEKYIHTINFAINNILCQFILNKTKSLARESCKKFSLLTTVNVMYTDLRC